MSELFLATYLILWILVLLQGVLVLGSLRTLGLIQLRLGAEPGALITRQGLARGALAPDFELPDVTTRQLRRLSDFLGRRSLLVFVSPTCQTCMGLMPHLNAVAKAFESDLSVVVVCQGTDAACLAFARLYRIRTPVLADLTNGLLTKFGASATPFAFLLNREGRILIRGIANDWMQLESLLHEEGTLQGAMEWTATGDADLSVASAAPQHLKEDSHA